MNIQICFVLKKYLFRNIRQSQKNDKNMEIRADKYKSRKVNYYFSLLLIYSKHCLLGKAIIEESLQNLESRIHL